MRSTFCGLLLSALFFSVNGAVAQQPNRPVNPAPQHSEDLSGAGQSSKGGAPQASPELQSLIKALSGAWSLSVKWEPDASTPNGLVNTGEENWRAGPGGYTLVEEEHLRMPQQGDVFLLGVVWWNSTTKNLQGMECQNLLPYTCDVKGALKDITMSWDGKQFVIDEIETSNTDKKSMWHEVWSDITPDSFIQSGEYGEIGAPRKRLFTIHAKRVTTQSKNDRRGAKTRSSQYRIPPNQLLKCRVWQRGSGESGRQRTNLSRVACLPMEAPAQAKKAGELGPVDTFSWKKSTCVVRLEKCS
jgi:hypothetical protein